MLNGIIMRQPHYFLHEYCFCNGTLHVHRKANVKHRTKGTAAKSQPSLTMQYWAEEPTGHLLTFASAVCLCLRLHTSRTRLAARGM